MPTTAATKKPKKNEVFYHYAFDDVIAILKSGEYPYMAGDSGGGKNIIAEQCAEVLSKDAGVELPFGFSSKVSSEYKLKGFRDAHGRYTETLFVSLYKNGGVFFLDEIDASDPDALTALNAAIANGYLDIDHHEPDQRIAKMHPHFYLVAGGNTKGFGATLKFTGRQPLDGATLSRFTLVDVGYDVELERKIARKLNGQKGVNMTALVHQVRAAVKELQLDEIQNVGTRELVKAINFEKNDFSREKALLKATMDKLEEGDVEKVLAKVDKKVKQLAKDTSQTKLNGLLGEIAKTSKSLDNLTEVREKLEKALATAKETSKTAFEVAGDVGAEIKVVESGIRDLGKVRDMLSGLGQTAPAIEAAVEEALKNIHDAATKPEPK